MEIGVKKGKLQMEEYDPEWAVRGQKMVALLKSVMKKAVDVQHAGSTAIPGMFAKPLIDIIVAVNDFDDILEYVDELEEMGIHYSGEYIKGQREFYQDSPDGQKRICHIHVVLKDSQKWNEYLAIRDYCIANQEKKNLYIALKRELLEKYGDEPEKYGPAKHEFMDALAEEAQAWKRSVEISNVREKEQKKNFLEVISEIAEKMPEKTAFVDQDGRRKISYRRFNELVGKVAAKLKNMQFEKGSFIIIQMERSMEYLAAYYGILRAGYVLIPTIPEYPEERIAYIRQDCGAPLVITGGFFQDIEDYEADLENPELEDERIVCMNYTSGSTGHPKGVYYNMRCVNENICRASMLMEDLRENLVVAVTVPMSFAAFSHDCLGALFLGAEIHIISEEMRKDVRRLIEYYNQHEITCGGMNPGMLRLFPKTKGLKRILTYGQRLSGVYSSEYEIYNVYGLTEAFTAVTYFKVDQGYDNTPIGKTYGGLKVEILDKDGNEVPDLTEGEICVTGHLSQGYYHNPEETAKNYEQMGDNLRRFHTHDLGYRNENGDIVYVNRMDWMIKINGQRVEPYEVETAIRHVDQVEECIVKAYEDARGKTSICAYYIADPGVTPEKIREEIGKKLPPYMIPSDFVRMEQFPLTPNGKYDRNQLKPPCRADKKDSYEAPVNEKERKICAAMEKVLQIEKVGRKDDFSALGGDSLSVMELLLLLEDDNLQVSDILQNGTPEKLAQVMERKQTEHFGEEEASCRKKSYPLTGYQNHFYQYSKSFPEIALGNTPVLVSFPHGMTTPEKIAESAYHVLRHHPAYSMILCEEEGRVTQKLGENIVSAPEIIRLSEAEFQERRRDLVKRIDIQKSPLYRCRIYATEKADYLFLDAHHTITDKTALDLTIRDLCADLKGEELPEDFYFSYLEELQKIREDQEIAEKRTDPEYAGHPQFDYQEDDCQLEMVVELTDETSGEFKRKMEKMGATPLEYFLAVTLEVEGIYNKNRKEKVHWLYSGRDTRRKQNMGGLLATELSVEVDLSQFHSMEELLKEIKRRNQRNINNRTQLLLNDTARPVEDDVLVVNYIPYNEKTEQQWKKEGLHVESLINESKYNTNVFYVIVLEGESDKPLQILFKYHKKLYKKANMDRFIQLYMEKFKEYLL